MTLLRWTAAIIAEVAVNARRPLLAAGALAALITSGWHTAAPVLDVLAR